MLEEEWAAGLQQHMDNASASMESSACQAVLKALQEGSDSAAAAEERALQLEVNN